MLEFYPGGGAIGSDLPAAVRAELNRENMVDSILHHAGDPTYRIDGVRVEYTHDDSTASLIIMDDD